MKNGLNDNIVRVVKSSADGKIWIGTEERGLTIYDAESKVAQAQNTLDELMKGADSLDVKAQNLTIEQRQNTLVKIRTGYRS